MYGMFVMVSLLQAVNPYDMFKHGLLCVLKEKELNPSTDIYIESYPSEYFSLTYVARNETVDLTNERLVLSSL